jgi:hypothetical protein
VLWTLSFQLNKPFFDILEEVIEKREDNSRAKA